MAEKLSRRPIPRINQPYEVGDSAPAAPLRMGSDPWILASTHALQMDPLPLSALMPLPNNGLGDEGMNGPGSGCGRVGGDAPGSRSGRPTPQLSGHQRPTMEERPMMARDSGIGFRGHIRKRPQTKTTCARGSRTSGGAMDPGRCPPNAKPGWLPRPIEVISSVRHATLRLASSCWQSSSIRAGL